MKYFVNIDDHEVEVEIAPRPGGGYVAHLGDRQSVVFVSERSPTDLTLRVGERVLDWVVSRPAPELSVAGSGLRLTGRVESARARALASMHGGGAASDDGTVKSPMPGKIVKVLVGEGQDVEAGQAVIVVEAMKMENELAAPRSGQVKRLHVAEGDTVEGAAALLTIA
ncbi:MAG: biotin/lipoyl-containing protein [Polyangiaceae bacterium]